MLLKHYLEQGVSKAKLSRRLGVNRRTIQRWVGAGQLKRDMAEGGAVYSRRPRVRHQPYPYKGIIGTRLAQYPRLSAKRLFDEVQAAGYTGGYGRVRDNVRAVRASAPPLPSTPTSTMPRCRARPRSSPAPWALAPSPHPCRSRH